MHSLSLRDHGTSSTVDIEREKGVVGEENRVELLRMARNPAIFCVGGQDGISSYTQCLPELG